MPSALVRALTERMNLPIIDETSVDAFLACGAGEADHTIIFFTGDPAQRSEANDVAVVLPEILRTFQGKLRGAVVRRGTEDKLKSRFHVVIMPSLVVMRGSEIMGILPKIRDWSEYMTSISAWLAPDAAPMTPPTPQKVEINYAGERING
ncbi:hydrogenase accessory protein [Rhizobium sp. L1K21]|uniref:hydrogenase accessory protein n=1 Tax=Rhizobium sp. L1K21 TaxID=2954933 RepID=UPI0020926DA5|nr:hydrogenase accessory protein [Rhizobium sp. L1K21]MCO6184611.1 hydrogenase accessory protein [Rhizobium sp. L1K21]